MRGGGGTGVQNHLDRVGAAGEEVVRHAAAEHAGGVGRAGLHVAVESTGGRRAPDVEIVFGLESVPASEAEDVLVGKKKKTK